MSNVLKSCVTASALFLSLLATRAEVLVVEPRDGQEQYYDLGVQPVLTYSGPEMLVRTNNTSATFRMADVKKCYFNKDVTKDDLLKDGDKAIVWIEGQSLVFRNAQPNMPVQLFTAEGKTLGMSRTDANGELTLNLPLITKGIVIVKTPTATLKIAR